jgi:hypothetical protein
MVKCDPLIKDNTIPPIMPAINPEIGGTPDAKDIPKHKGKAIKETMLPDSKSLLQF